MKYNKVVIGVDQSYSNTGISISCDGQLKKIGSVHLDKLSCNSERRGVLRKKLEHIIKLNVNKAKEVQIIVERIRLQSQGFININYIKSIGALNSTIVDVAREYNLKVYSVDTRAWKSQIVGTSKELANKIGIDPKKWPTIQYIIRQGWEDSILLRVSNKKKKGVLLRGDEKYTYNDDAADSACISLYGFIPKNNQKLEEEH